MKKIFKKSPKTKKEKLEQETTPKDLVTNLPQNDTEIPAEDYMPTKKTVVGLANENKSEHIKNYFSTVIGKETKEKRHKDKKKKRSIYILIFLVLVGILGIMLNYIYFYNFKQSEDNLTKEINKTEYEVSLPKEIPLGYQVASATEYNKDNQTFTATFEFVNDKSRKLIFSQEKTDSPDLLLEEYKKAVTQPFETKEIDGTSYTIFTDGSISWAKNEYYYNIRVEGETYKDLVLKMATSVE